MTGNPTAHQHDRPRRPRPPAVAASRRHDETRIVERRAGRGWTVCVDGDLDIAGVAPLRAALHRLAWRREPATLDLRAATFLDAGGVGLLVALSDAADSTGWEFAVVPGLGRAAQRAVDLTGAGPFIRFADVRPLEARAPAPDSR